AGLCDRLLGLRNADLASWFGEGGGAAPSGQLLRELREKEDVIQQMRGDLRRQEAVLQSLAVESSERLKVIHALQGQLEVQRPPVGLLGRVVGKLRRGRAPPRGAAPGASGRWRRRARRAAPPPPASRPRAVSASS